MGRAKYSVRPKPIPRVSSPSQTLEMNDYSHGFDNFVSNDKFPVRSGGTNKWRLAQDARIVTLGEYDTRKGFDFHSVAVGETKDDNQESVTGTADRSFSTTTRLAQKITTTAAGRLPRLDLRLKNDAGASGTVLVELWSNVSGKPGAMLARTSLANSSLTAAYAYLETRYASAPALAVTTDYWIVAYVQNTGSGSYKWSSTSSGSDALVSTDSGSTWTAAGYALNFKQYYATDAPVKGLYRAYKSDGTKVTLMAAGTTLYSVHEVTGALTTIKTGLSANATLYRFQIANDVVYYVNGHDGYRKWDFVTESQVNATNYTDLTTHKGLMFLKRADDGASVDYSNYLEYEVFTSTDNVLVPVPKTGDPVASMSSLNGYLLLRTLNRCFILSGEDSATFRLDEAPDQKGTYTPKTSVMDKNYNYFLSNDGVYRSNGTQPELISESIYETIRSLTNKDDAVLAVSKGRLYLWYRSAGSAYNDSCYVWNLNYKSESDTVESHDTGAYVSHAVSGFQDDDDLLVGSSIIGQAYWQEKDSNDYCNLGGDINFLLRTHYFTFTSPAVLKEIRNWQPRFAAQSGNYVIECQYAYDLRGNWTGHIFPGIQGTGSIWGDGSMVWGSFTWGASAEVQAQSYVPGEYRRIAIGYKHYAARQPQKFLGHTLVIQSRRLR
jgi:hypothetical protein